MATPKPLILFSREIAIKKEMAVKIKVKKEEEKSFFKKLWQ